MRFNPSHAFVYTLVSFLISTFAQIYKFFKQLRNTRRSSRDDQFLLIHIKKYRLNHRESLAFSLEKFKFYANTQNALNAYTDMLIYAACVHKCVHRLLCVFRVSSIYQSKFILEIILGAGYGEEKRLV